MADYDEEYDPLDERAPVQRDSKGRFPKGVSGNPRGRRIEFPRDPSLPASRRRIINAVADEMVEVKVNGKVRQMSMFEANVRALAMDGTRNRVAAQRFLELAMQTSETHLLRRLASHQVREYYDQIEKQNEELREQVAPTSGVLTVPWSGSLGEWPPEGLIDDDRRINMAMLRELRGQHAKEDTGGSE